MGHKNKLSLVGQIQKTYDGMLAIGESKHFDKRNGGIQDKIYSWNTYRTYMKHANYFAAYCKEKYKCKTLEACRPYVDEYLKKLIDEGKSAYTQKLEASALAKLYGCRTTDFIKTETRKRENITRSRGEKIRDAHFSEENHAMFVRFCRATGLRKAELEALTGDKLVFKDGDYFVRVDAGSKGGRSRLVPVLNSGAGDVVSLMDRAGSGKVFESIPNGADIHSYRSDYATAIYRQNARDIKDIPYDKVTKAGKRYQGDVYTCRGDRKGVKLDRAAMLKASQALGHNRVSVVGEHYLQGVD